MSLFSKVLSLIIVQIFIIVICLYVHLDDLTPKNSIEQTINESPSFFESVKNLVVQKTEPLDKEQAQSQQTKMPAQEKITTSEEQPKMVESVDKKMDEKTEVVLTEVTNNTLPIKEKKKVEVKKEVQKTTLTIKTKKITDEKVKELFEKKKLKVDTSISASTMPKNDEAIEKEISKVVEQTGIIFKRMSTEVTEKSMLTIEKIAQILKENQHIQIEIGGHTDAKGDDDVNKYISKHRALSVKKLLVKYGINKDRLIAKGYGESQPIVKNDPQGYSIKNRRVEFKVIKE